MSNKPTRCAIYTRKSTEEGLDKEFNTLEAQREACEAYIKSQMHEGWILIPKLYDDGGYTGGNIERPALQALLADIRKGLVDVIVVYKVDRLSRSLNDFAQMVNVFDAHNVSFVSITQQFNTTTSMGRLTLNILLSFAQFEREVISERVRDKVAASKQKGMWMGGVPPLGYDIVHRKLVVNEEEAKLIRQLFTRYIELRSGAKLAHVLNAAGYTNKNWVNRKGKEAGGQPFTYQAIAKILNNPTYIGKVRHHTKIYEGQHEAIVSEELWEQSRQVLKENGTPRVKRNTKHGSLLTGKCFNPSGEMYGQTYTLRKNIHYRYYILRSSSHRIKGQELETLVFETIRALAEQPEHWQECWRKQTEHLIEEEIQHRWQTIWRNWLQMPNGPRQEIAKQVIDRIVITKHQVTIRLGYEGIGNVARDFASSGGVRPDEAPKVELISRPEIIIRDTYVEIAIAARFQLYGRTQMVLDAKGKAIHIFPKTQNDKQLVQTLVKAYRWNRMIENGEATVTQLAAEMRVGRTYISRTVNILLLAPDIISAILNGKQPPTLRVKDLMQNLPHCWNAQRELLKFT